MAKSGVEAVALVDRRQFSQLAATAGAQVLGRALPIHEVLERGQKCGREARRIPDRLEVAGFQVGHDGQEVKLLCIGRKNLSVSAQSFNKCAQGDEPGINRRAGFFGKLPPQVEGQEIRAGDDQGRGKGILLLEPVDLVKKLDLQLVDGTFDLFVGLAHNSSPDSAALAHQNPASSMTA